MVSVQTPARQPFGVLGESKLRNLQSIKNRQNGMITGDTLQEAATNQIIAIVTASSAPSLKRRATSPGLSDSENVDPIVFEKGNAKRKRSAFDDDVSASKQPRIYVKPTPPSTKVCMPSPAPVAVTPRTNMLQKPTSTPVSAPAAAGRTPPRARDGVFAKPRGRFIPPSFHSKSPSLSIAAALQGTLAQSKRPSLKRSRSTSDKKTPASWDFAIFEESEEVQDYRMSEWTMTQSSATLGISDDEDNSTSDKRADKGKENVDPNGMFVLSAPITRSAARAAQNESATMDMSEPRSPLGNLEAAKFYGEGLDATSVVLVHDDDTETVVDEQDAPSIDAAGASETPEDTPQFTFEAPLTQPLEQEEFAP
ncbi:hypothetical protein LTR66_017265, partial [Elasticomyces elasticus]